mgnify:CR=1 FL=1
MSRGSAQDHGRARRIARDHLADAMHLPMGFFLPDQDIEFEPVLNKREGYRKNFADWGAAKVARFTEHPDRPGKAAYYLASAVVIYTAWQVAVGLGVAILLATLVADQVESR